MYKFSCGHSYVIYTTYEIDDIIKTLHRIQRSCLARKARVFVSCDNARSNLLLYAFGIKQCPTSMIVLGLILFFQQHRHVAFLRRIVHICVWTMLQVARIHFVKWVHCIAIYYSTKAEEKCILIAWSISIPSRLKIVSDI